MTGFAESSHEMEASPSVMATLPVKTTGTFSDLWPAFTVGFGIVLTIAWTGGLSWLLISLLLLVI